MNHQDSYRTTAITLSSTVGSSQVFGDGPVKGKPHSSCRLSCGLLLHGFQIHLHLHGGFSELTTRFERLMPLETPVPPIDLSRRAVARAPVSPPILADAIERRVQCHEDAASKNN